MAGKRIVSIDNGQLPRLPENLPPIPDNLPMIGQLSDSVVPRLVEGRREYNPNISPGAVTQASNLLVHTYFPHIAQQQQQQQQQQQKPLQVTDPSELYIKEEPNVDLELDPTIMRGFKEEGQGDGAFNVVISHSQSLAGGQQPDLQGEENSVEYARCRCRGLASVRRI